MSKHHDTYRGKGLRPGLAAASEKTKIIGNFGPVCAWLFCISLLCFPGAGYSQSDAISTISFSNFELLTSAGSVQYEAVWGSQAFAQGQNSLGQIDQEFASTTGGTSSIGATVTYATASALANGVSLSGAASSNVSILGATAQAISTGIGTLSNTFEITGGTGSVMVTFSVQIVGSESVATSQLSALAQTQTLFAVQVNGLPVLTFDPTLSVGPGSSASNSFDETLSITMPLNFDTLYSLTVVADQESEVISTTPEPSTACFAFIGLAVLGAYIRRKRTQTSS